jgi:hypothetical protein
MLVNLRPLYRANMNILRTTNVRATYWVGPPWWFARRFILPRALAAALSRKWPAEALNKADASKLESTTFDHMKNPFYADATEEAERTTRCGAKLVCIKSTDQRGRKVTTWHGNRTPIQNLARPAPRAHLRDSMRVDSDREVIA